MTCAALGCEDGAARTSNFFSPPPSGTSGRWPKQLGWLSQGLPEAVGQALQRTLRRDCWQLAAWEIVTNHWIGCFSNCSIRFPAHMFRWHNRRHRTLECSREAQSREAPARTDWTLIAPRLQSPPDHPVWPPNRRSGLRSPVHLPVHMACVPGGGRVTPYPCPARRPSGGRPASLRG